MRRDSVSAKLAVLAILAASATAFVAFRTPDAAKASHVEPTNDRAEPAAKPRDLLGRLWFDKLPKKRTDEVTVALFFSGGIGLFESGSSYRFTFDLFEFERRSADLDLVLLHDKKRAQVKYTVKDCDDSPPFDLCLELEGAPRGPKKLYGFAYDDDEAASIPWARDLREAGRAMTRGK
jgi:hypothetical protein